MRRAVAILPLLLYGHVLHTYVGVALPHALWVCNLSCLLMAIGIAANRPLLVWVAVLWQWVGLPLWLLDGVMDGDWQPHSFGVHLVCPAVGVWWLRELPPRRSRLALAVGYFVGLQAFCRVFTPASLNVNVAHEVLPWMSAYTTHYPMYWVLNLAVLLLLLGGTDRVLSLIVRTPPAERLGIEKNGK